MKDLPRASLRHTAKQDRHSLRDTSEHELGGSTYHRLDLPPVFSRELLDQVELVGAKKSEIFGRNC